jgi:hypothetical protein
MEGTNQMTASLEQDTFSRHLNTKFRIALGEAGPFEVELSEVTELRLSPGQERFSTIFRGPREAILEQGSYTFEHDEMGEFILFIVAIGQDETGTFYEAVFNRLSTAD